MTTHYSPYNKTYKFICLQNQVAHIRNKASVKSRGDSNISLTCSPEHYSTNDPNKMSSYLSTKADYSSIMLK